MAVTRGRSPRSPLLGPSRAAKTDLADGARDAIPRELLRPSPKRSSPERMLRRDRGLLDRDVCVSRSRVVHDDADRSPTESASLRARRRRSFRRRIPLETRRRRRSLRRRTPLLCGSCRRRRFLVLRLPAGRRGGGVVVRRQLHEIRVEKLPRVHGMLVFGHPSGPRHGQVQGFDGWVDAVRLRVHRSCGCGVTVSKVFGVDSRDRAAGRRRGGNKSNRGPTTMTVSSRVRCMDHRRCIDIDLPSTRGENAIEKRTEKRRKMYFIGIRHTLAAAARAK